MTDNEIESLVALELTNPTRGTLEQFLEIHSFSTTGSKPIIARIDRDSMDQIIAYLPVQDQKFHLALCIDPKTKSLVGSYSEPYSKIYFQASSEDISLENLKAKTLLPQSKAWSKGDQSDLGKHKYAFSYIAFEPNPVPDSFEDKLSKLLNQLEKDPNGVRDLCQSANGSIQAAITFHYGNGMLGGPSIPEALIKRMSALNLEIHFDLYVEGKAFR